MGNMGNKTAKSESFCRPSRRCGCQAPKCRKGERESAAVTTRNITQAESHGGNPWQLAPCLAKSSLESIENRLLSGMEATPSHFPTVFNMGVKSEQWMQ